MWAWNTHKSSSSSSPPPLLVLDPDQEDMAGPQFGLLASAAAVDRVCGTRVMWIWEKMVWVSLNVHDHRLEIRSGSGYIVYMSLAL